MEKGKEYDKKILDRVAMFSDAVYGIVLTLLVLELKVKDLGAIASSSDMIEKLKELLPNFIAIVLSAKLIGGIWIGTSKVQVNIIKSSNRYIVYSVTFIALISLLPFCCAIIGNYYTIPFSYVLFGSLMILLALVGRKCLKILIKDKLMDPSVELNRVITMIKLIPWLILYVAVTAASAYYNIYLCIVMFVLYIITPGLVMLTNKITKNKLSH